MGFVVKTYRDVCADLIILLEDIEESLEEITRAAQLPENQQDLEPTENKSSWLERHFDFSLKTKS